MKKWALSLSWSDSWGCDYPAHRSEFERRAACSRWRETDHTEKTFRQRRTAVLLLLQLCCWIFCCFILSSNISTEFLVFIYMWLPVFANYWVYAIRCDYCIFLYFKCETVRNTHYKAESNKNSLLCALFMRVSILRELRDKCMICCINIVKSLLYVRVMSSMSLTFNLIALHLKLNISSNSVRKLLEDIPWNLTRGRLWLEWKYSLLLLLSHKKFPHHGSIKCFIRMHWLVINSWQFLQCNTLLLRSTGFLSWSRHALYIDSLCGTETNS